MKSIIGIISFALVVSSTSYASTPSASGFATVGNVQALGTPTQVATTSDAVDGRSGSTQVSNAPARFRSTAPAGCIFLIR